MDKSDTPEALKPRDLNSLLYWYPKIVGKILTPRTEIVKIPFETIMKFLHGTGGLEKYRQDIFASADKIGYPLFLRTDQSSGKHQWKDTCYVPDREGLMQHISQVCESDALADIMGLPTQALVFREFLHLKSIFTAFNGMPVAREFRCFADSGKIKCVHPYWFEGAIKFWEGRKMEIKGTEFVETPAPEPKDWRRRLKEISQYTAVEYEILKHMAERASELVGGAWSVDLCQTQDNDWYLTDMAVASQSYHYPHEGESKQ